LLIASWLLLFALQKLFRELPGATAEYFRNKLNDLVVADWMLCGTDVHALVAVD
jgi:hypothetical protein